MSIETAEELAALREAGRIVQRALVTMRDAVRPGVHTQHLDELAAAVLRREHARSAPNLVYGFPGSACISLNDEIVHGVPSRVRVVRRGDLVKLDVTVEKEGFMADAAITVPVGEASVPATSLVRCAERALESGLRAARAGARVCDIGRAVEHEALAHGFAVVRELCGHGIGRTIHEDPQVPNWNDPRARDWLTEGLVITVEPILAIGGGHAYETGDGWTWRTRDGGTSAHVEHTIVIRRGAPEILTAA